MTRRPFLLGLAAGCILAGQSGCIPDHSHFLRHKSEADRPDGVAALEPTEEAKSDPTEDVGKFHLKPSQRPGALSDTGADIERSLGIGR